MQIFKYAKEPDISAIYQIPDGENGTRATLKIMRKLVRAGRKNLAVRNMALALTNDLLQKDYLSEIRRVHNFVRDEIRYVRDVNEVETLHTAEKVLEQLSGDCDDKAILAASLLESIGHPTRFIAAGRGMTRGEFEHVYIETRYGDKWLSLECTEPVPLGWKPENMREFLVVNN
jgi:transglutaminase-like putative cysteine protease